MGLRRSGGLLLSVVAAGSLVAAGCTGGESDRAEQAPPKPPGLTVTPAPDARNVPVSAEIGTAVTGGKVTGVRLTDDKGVPVAGAMRSDGSSWIPASPLAHKRTYRAEVVATNGAGATITGTTRFTTMEQPTNRVETSLNVQDNGRYGVAMPITVAFGTEVPAAARASVERRLFVRTEPSQPGVWHWTANGRQVSYRPPDFWRTGTRLIVRTAMAGLPMGGSGYGDADHVATAQIGEKVAVDIDNATKQMSVYKGDRLLRKIPVSLGKSSTPTSSGKMVIMEKHDWTTFDTRGEPNGGYVATVADAQRLTWGGEFIHAAPWSEGDQGVRNVSHGCTNVSSENAAWLMGVTQVGDLVTVTGTEVALEPGNGWTAWDLSWAEFIKGSALPVPTALRPSVVPAPPVAGSGPRGVTPSPSGGPGPTPSGGGR